MTEQTTVDPGTDPGELDGLSKAIGEALAAHPLWMRDNAGTIICAGPGCTWEKRDGKTTQQRWTRHQTWAVSAAVRAWYVA